MLTPCGLLTMALGGRGNKGSCVVHQNVQGPTVTELGRQVFYRFYLIYCISLTLRYVHCKMRGCFIYTYERKGHDLFSCDMPPLVTGTPLSEMSKRACGNQLYSQQPFKVGTTVPILQLRKPRLRAQVLDLMLCRLSPDLVLNHLLQCC